MKTLWGKAFKNQQSAAVINFTAGHDVVGKKAADYHLLPYDILGSQAHVFMLYEEKIIGKEDAEMIFAGLKKIASLVKKGEFKLDPNLEDVHTNIESYLTKHYGIDTIGKLHTARSRNDQSNLDTRLFIRDKTLEYIKNLIILCENLVDLSKKYKDYLMPGFTHHQHAMITTFGHVLMSFASMVSRDAVRFSQWYDLHNNNPLGSVAGYGTTFPINPALTTELLGFDCPVLNSLDPITNRWEPEADFVFAISIFMNHLSLMAETFILMATPQFGMVTLADEFSTGSSIMPQKKNPDPLEVMKGKTAYVASSLQTLMSLGKGNFIGYNRDSQWSKYALIDAVEESTPAAEIMCGVVKTMKVHKSNMEKWCYLGFIGAPSLMEQISLKFKLPFRKTKMIVENAVKYSEGNESVSYEALMNALKKEGINISITKEEVKKFQDPNVIIQLTQSFGGPGKKSIMKSIELLENNLKKHKNWLSNKLKEKKNALDLLEAKITEIFR